ncbi:hypothetical protein [Salinicola sp. DM10]|uniref:hypothetical protein n=1 Tax=Salinicola sp. DM10 TaxID=2815721 RepID=UPI001E3ABFE9|nr:hypothetical protein [Salinicola sp. DM10]MCE3028585.1 hypothetical protein [Salinicola sp. DM10]
MAEAVKLLTVLDRLAQYRPAGHQAPFERRVNRGATWALVAGGVLLALLGGLVLVHLTLGPLPAAFRWVALGLGLLAQLVSLVPLCVPILLAGRLLVCWRRIAREDLIREFRHDRAAVDRLAGFSTAALAEVQPWLEIKVRRLDRRVTLFFGSPTAGVSLFLLASSAIEALGGVGVLSALSPAGIAWTRAGALQLAALVAVCLLLGLSLGAMAQRWLATRYAFQAELVGLALQRRSARRA